MSYFLSPPDNIDLFKDGSMDIMLFGEKMNKTNIEKVKPL